MTTLQSLLFVGAILLIAVVAKNYVLPKCLAAPRVENTLPPRVENKIIRYTASPSNPVTAEQMIDEISANLSSDGGRKINASDIQLTLIDLVAFIENRKGN